MPVRNYLLEVFPDGMSSGFRAMTVQSYIEANVKNGVQWEYSIYDPSMSGDSDLIFITGADTVLVKGQTVTLDGLGVISSVYRGPSYTSGTSQAFHNMNDRNQATSGVSLLTGVNVSNEGVKIVADKLFLGSSTVGAVVTTSDGFGAIGGEYVLAPNTAYLFRSASLGGGAQRFFNYFTWYEGGTDLPL